MTPKGQNLSEEEVQRTANQMLEVSAASVRESLKEEALGARSYSDVMAVLPSESDRGAVLTLFAFIADRFRHALTDAFYDAPVAKELLEGMGPLSTASAQIKLAYALGWISKDSYDSLRTIRKIRNNFAHDALTANLSHVEIRPLVEELVAPIFERAGDFYDFATTPRLRFHAAGSYACVRAMTEMWTAPACQRAALPPGHLVTAEWEKLPKPVRELLKDHIRGMGKIMTGLGYEFPRKTAAPPSGTSPRQRPSP